MPITEASGVPAPGQQCKSLQERLFEPLPAARTAIGAPRRLCSLYPRVCKSFTIALLTGFVVFASGGFATATTEQERMARQAQQLVDGLRERLGIAAPVVVRVVERDPRTMSVRARGGHRDSFELSVESRFVAALPAAQLEAALAHELGHVWISTNHPYLQTEQLANRVAMRVVTRERLVEVYRTLWGAEAVHGSLETFLGVSPSTAAQQ